MFFSLLHILVQFLMSSYFIYVSAFNHDGNITKTLVVCVRTAAPQEALIAHLVRKLAGRF